ncbi:unnamed protein product [Sphagnum troendelagicum]|uniref:Core-2/I-branching beta-1,6-N-acetylglucosaminyltransferase family protein n=1 Tax=Sphagnum troendelagicum TaxID=128251 RepID=A0ABP0U408_9BRYO
MVTWRWMVRQRRLVLSLGLSVLFLSLFSSAFVYKFGAALGCDFLKGNLCKNVSPLSSIAAPLPLPQDLHKDLSAQEQFPPPLRHQLPSDLELPRNYSDDELTARVLAQDSLSRSTLNIEQPKLAFMFLTPGPLPFEGLWDRFFEGHEDRYSVYVHASKKESLGSIWKGNVFKGREIRSEKVFWGQIAMVDAERRLLANALQDKRNQYFVLLSETCVPLHDFNYIYNYLLGARMSFVDCFDDPGPHGLGRYSDRMMPEVSRRAWRKGAQWFAITRQHALLVVADNFYYRKFSSFCKPGPENHNCYPDEHYVQTFLHIMDPSHLANWTVTHVDWSEGKWHPKSYATEDVTETTLAAIQAINYHVHVNSDGEAKKSTVPCLWNGEHRPCFLFARKFLPETADILSKLLPQLIWQRSQGTETL